MMIKYDYNLLINRIKNRFSNFSNFSNILGITEESLLLKLKNKIDFEQTEISKTCDLLEIDAKDIKTYFFRL